VSVAVFTGQKGHEKVLPLVAKLAQEGLHVRLTLVGDGPTRKTCEALTESLGISDLVTFTGALDDVVPELDAADLFVHLPDFETFGIVLAEAMARGLPSMSLQIGGIPEVVMHGQTGLLAAPDASNAYTLLKELIVDPNKRLLAFWE
jgi:glycosyltransferase involved in cell wall biosynthesis